MIRWRGEPAPPLGAPPAGRRPVLKAVLAIGAWIAAQAVIGIPVVLAFGGTDINIDELSDNLGYLAATAAASGIAAGVVFVVFSRLIGWTGTSAGLRGASVWRSVGIGFAALIVYGVLATIWASLVTSDDEHVLIEALENDNSLAGALAIAFAACITAPIGEELLFRGLLFRAFSRWGHVQAAFLSGAIFGALHIGSAPVVHLVPLSLLGAAFGIVFWRTGSLLPCIALHMLINSFGVATTVGDTEGAQTAWALGLIAASWALLWLVSWPWRVGRWGGGAGTDTGVLALAEPERAPSSTP